MLPAVKAVTAIVPISKTNAATATGAAIDCQGYRYCTIHVSAATADVVSNKPTVLVVQESDTTDTSNFSNVSGLVGGTDFTVANSLTSVPNDYLFGINLMPRRRYLRVNVSPATTQVISGSALLFRAEQSPITAANAGVLNLVLL